MMKWHKKRRILPLLWVLAALMMVFALSGCAKRAEESEATAKEVAEDGCYTDKEHVALYLHTYRHLPSNYITKEEAYDLGWKSAGTLEEVAPGKSIGGDEFGNFEGNLPEKSGRTYYECDIGYKSGNRNAKRIVYSNDGLIYYTEDHYETFEKLYDGWE